MPLHTVVLHGCDNADVYCRCIAAILARAGCRAIRYPRVHTAVQTSRPSSQKSAIPGSDGAATDILVKQRLSRPVAPHLTIWRFQVHYIASGLNRITGVILSGGFFLFFMGYAAAPYLGWNLTSSSLASSFASWPTAGKVLTKGIVAFPFVFHSFNGLRHLYMDVGAGFMKGHFIKSGFLVFGLSAVGTLYLACIA